LALEIATARRPAKTPADIRQLIRDMSIANPLWGAPRIHGELLKLGIDVGQTSAHWIARQLTEAYGWQQTPRYIVRDRDCVYGAVVIERLRAMGIRDRPISPRSPWQNGYSERLIGSIRRDCLDHVIVFGERHLRHLLNSYQKYYNEARTHLSLHKDAPIPRAVQTVGRTLAVPVLGGLHHQYLRA
jgi:Integrase core domain